MKKSWMDTAVSLRDRKIPDEIKNETPPTPMTADEKKKYRLVLLRRTFSYLSVGLVLSAVIGGLYGDRMHFIWALCASGAVLIAMGWWEYLRVTDSLSFIGRKKQKKEEVPYSLRKEKEKKRHKPAFMQRAEDFEDDLTPYTAVDTDLFTEKQLTWSLVISRIAAGVLLFAASFVIPQ